jgi:hypothetical protein
MRSFTSPLRLLSVVSRFSLLWLLAAACADVPPDGCGAALTPAHAGERVTPTQPASGVAHARRPRKPRRPRVRLAVTDLLPRVGHLVIRHPGAGVVVQDDDPPAAHDARPGCLAPSFCSIGVVVAGGAGADAPSRPFSPQSPRGPPPAA